MEMRVPPVIQMLPVAGSIAVPAALTGMKLASGSLSPGVMSISW
jgi:hypothetical protein